MMELDDIDDAIVALLREDPQIANKAIATELGLAEATVASRIRALIDKRAIRVAAQRDVVAMGNNLIAHIDIHVEGRAVDDVAAELGAIEEISSVSIHMGSPQIIAQVHTRDEAAFLDILKDRLARVTGIERIESTISLSVLKYRTDMADLVGKDD